MLYKLPGYEQAEVTGNQNEQVRIINELATREPKLKEYFEKAGLGSLMSNLIDAIGKNGLKRRHSPKALLEFYSDKKGLNWFDRTQETYVQAWRIQVKNKWQRGEESAKLAIEAIEDILYQLPGYKEAERTNNRDEQIRIIRDLVIRERKLTNYFRNAGLDSLMKQLIDPSGRQGLRKRYSPKALLEFYSEMKRLVWFNQNQMSYLTTNMQGWLKVVYKNSK